MTVTFNVIGNLKIAENKDDAETLRKYGIFSISADIFNEMRQVLEPISEKYGIDIIVTLSQRKEQTDNNKQDTKTKNKPTKQSVIELDLKEEVRLEKLAQLVREGKRLRMFDQEVGFDPNRGKFLWGSKTFDSASALANAVALATGRGGRYNGWAVLKIED